MINSTFLRRCILLFALNYYRFCLDMDLSIAPTACAACLAQSRAREAALRTGAGRIVLWHEGKLCHYLLQGVRCSSFGLHFHLTDGNWTCDVVWRVRTVCSPLLLPFDRMVSMYVVYNSDICTPLSLVHWYGCGDEIHFIDKLIFRHSARDPGSQKSHTRKQVCATVTNR
ncbi:hypothetical protein F5141DRAFT_488289 [Pisolithus sp. B1]|nr:hypothetical protein F5141DRAFT_488289 [Pisolithus sp. B1]